MFPKTVEMKKEIVPGLAGNLRAAREKASLSQVEAGERSGVHHTAIAGYEIERRVPTLMTLYRLAVAYGVKVADLLPEDLPKEVEGKSQKKSKKNREGK
jgi:transcriptional regulator with XRE-family HTH domain